MANTLKFGNGEWYGKKDTILAYNDENNNYKPLPFNFSRASSATRVNKDGLIETVGSGEPRVDYKDDSKGALLLEPTRSNLITKSENIQDWNRASNATAEFGYEDPFKGNKAVKLTSSSTAQSYQVYQSTGALSSGSTYTFSMYAKKGTGHIFRLDFGIPDNGFVHIDLRDGSLLQESGSTYYDGYKVEPMSNGWYRISMVSTFNSSAYYRAGLYQEQGDCYVAFGQIEVGSYATSIIPTQGGVVTRVAESCSQTPPSGIIGQTEGAMFIEIGEKITPSIALFECGQGSSQHRFFVYTDANSKLKVLVVNNYSVQVNYTSTVNVESNAKIAIGYANNNYAIYLNGSLLATDTNATVPPMNQIAIGSDRGAIVTASNQIKETKVYNTRLSNTELQSLTTI